jgi:hypothetical protein
MRAIHCSCATVLAALSSGSFANATTDSPSPALNIDITQTSVSGFIGKCMP